MKKGTGFTTDDVYFVKMIVARRAIRWLRDECMLQFVVINFVVKAKARYFPAELKRRQR